MSNLKVINKAPVSLAELKEDLKNIQSRDEEIGFRAGKTLEYVNSFSTLSVEDYNKLKEKIHSLEIPRLKDEHVVKIADFLPGSVAELDVILQGYALTVSKENLAKLVEAIKEFK